MNSPRTSNWRRVRIDDVCKVQRGSSPRPIKDQRYFEGGRIPWIKIADATKSGKYLYNTKQKVNEFGASYSRLLPAGSLILAASGTLGYVQMLGVPGCIHDGWLHLYEFDGVESQFLYYWLRANPHLSGGAAYGAAIQNINTDILRSFEVNLPPLSTQTRIASILSTYDDLIENNTRRITVLEEITRRLYEEWFVHFRFPGHKGNGQPNDDWSKGTLQDVVVLQRGFDLPKKMRKSGDHPLFGATGQTGTHFEAKACGPGIVTGRSGSLGTVSYINTDFWPLNTTLWGKEFPLGSPYFAFFLLQSIDLKSFNAGAAVPTLNRNDIHGLPFNLPPNDLVQKFDEIVKPMFELKFLLEQKITNLRTQRDLLLPKLISSEIDVSEAAEAAQDAAE